MCALCWPYKREFISHSRSFHKNCPLVIFSLLLIVEFIMLIYVRQGQKQIPLICVEFVIRLLGYFHGAVIKLFAYEVLKISQWLLLIPHQQSVNLALWL
jgi:hypothetical protein